ncbi:hypothetical protein OF83DRAFT_1289825 [Amylostereum chailletii]|nr:hypothetical protein OF83DRAFT_1289825 [Amylostereum chailletii]
MEGLSGASASVGATTTTLRGPPHPSFVPFTPPSPERPSAMSTKEWEVQLDVERGRRPNVAVKWYWTHSQRDAPPKLIDFQTGRRMEKEGRYDYQKHPVLEHGGPKHTAQTPVIDHEDDLDDDEWADLPRVTPPPRSLSTPPSQREISTEARLAQFASALPCPPAFSAPLEPQATHPSPVLPDLRFEAWMSWFDDCTIHAINTFAFPPRPPFPPPSVFADGLWGLHEYTRYPTPFDRRAPWLMYMALEDPTLCKRLNKSSMWQAGPPGHFVVTARYAADLRRRREEIASQYARTAPTVLAHRGRLNRHVDTTNLLSFAVEHSTNAYGILVHTGVTSWPEFIAVLHVVRSALLELEAFLVWAEDMERYVGGHPSLVKGVHGAIFLLEDREALEVVAVRGLPAFFVARSADETPHCIGREIHAMDHDPNVRGKVFETSHMHSLPLEYYPPAAANDQLQFVREARGATPRTDDHRPNVSLAQKLAREHMKMENVTREERRRIAADAPCQAHIARVKRARGEEVVGEHPFKKFLKEKTHPAWNAEIQRRIDDAHRPTWMCAPWAPLDRAVTEVDPTSRIFAWFVRLWPQILRRPTLSKGDPAVSPLTPSQWKAHFDKQIWMDQCGYKIAFDIERPFDFGLPSMWGITISMRIQDEQWMKNTINGSSADPTRHLGLGTLDCGCVPTPAHFNDDSELRYAVIRRLLDEKYKYEFLLVVEGGNIPLDTAQLDFHTPVARSTSPAADIIRLVERVVLYNGPGKARGWDLPSHLERRGWIAALRDLFVHAKDFDVFKGCTGWGLSPADVRNATIESYSDASELDLYERWLLFFYAHSLFSLHGLIPTPLYPAPSLTSLQCRSHR